MTVNEIITNANNLTNAEKHTMRTILQNILNHTICSKVCRIIAARLYSAQEILYSLYDRFTNVLYNAVIFNRIK